MPRTMRPEGIPTPKVDKYNSLPKAEEYAEMSWPEFADSPESAAFYKFVASLIHKYIEKSGNQNLSCLDVGFGAGRTLYDIYTSGKAGRITGIEQSPAMLGLTRKILNEQEKVVVNGKTIIGKGLTNIELLPGSIEALPFQESSFDFLLCINVLDRIEYTVKGISELARVLRPNGILIIATAFDYEQLTPRDQRLSSDELLRQFVACKCTLVDNFETKLIKNIDGVTRSFEEYVYILIRGK